MEWWSNGVMKRPIQGKFGLLFVPTLQYSSTPKQVATFTGKAIELLPGPKDQVFGVE
jgi:hypothetical protein